jgi:hypothetical protein
VLACDLDLLDVRQRLRARRAPLVARYQRDHDPDDAAQLLRIFEALRRLDLGIYGQCVACGMAIDRQQLEDAPETTRCEVCSLF